MIEEHAKRKISLWPDKSQHCTLQLIQANHQTMLKTKTIALSLPDARHFIIALCMSDGSLLILALQLFVSGISVHLLRASCIDYIGFSPYITLNTTQYNYISCCSCHGFGTAALSANEPEALPFCAIAYALTGISASLFCSVPAFRQSLLVVVG